MSKDRTIPEWPRRLSVDKETTAAFRRRRARRCSVNGGAEGPHDAAAGPRFTEATLTRTLEEKGIGRPSTYATIIETIQARDYVFKKGNALVPSWTAFTVVRLLEEHLPSLVNYEFTAQMEDYLDAISRQEAEHVQVSCTSSTLAMGNPVSSDAWKRKEKEIDPREMSRF